MQYKILHLTIFNIAINEFATEIQYYKDKLKVLRGVTSQVRKFASNV